MQATGLPIKRHPRGVYGGDRTHVQRFTAACLTIRLRTPWLILFSRYPGVLRPWPGRSRQPLAMLDGGAAGGNRTPASCLQNSGTAIMRQRHKGDVVHDRHHPRIVSSLSPKLLTGSMVRIESNSYAAKVATHAYWYSRSFCTAERGRSRRPDSNGRLLLGRQGYSLYTTPTYKTSVPSPCWLVRNSRKFQINRGLVVPDEGFEPPASCF